MGKVHCRLGFIFILLLFFLANFIFFLNPADAALLGKKPPAPPTFFDDFNDGSYSPEWTVESGPNPAIVNGQLRLHSGSASRATVTTPISPLKGKVISLKFTLRDLTTSGEIFIRLRGDPSVLEYVFQIGYDDLLRLYRRNNSSYTLLSTYGWAPDTNQHDIKILFEEKNIWFWFGGLNKLYIRDDALASLSGTHLGLSALGTGVGADFDDITVKDNVFKLDGLINQQSVKLLTTDSRSSSPFFLPAPFPASASYPIPNYTHPNVLVFPSRVDGYKYWMYYTPFPPETVEFPWLVRSNDGFTWTEAGVVNPLLTVGGQGQFDSGYAADPCVIREDSTHWKMYDEGYNGNFWSIGVATSSDGKTWTKYFGSPIINHGTNSVRGSAPEVWKEGPNDYRMLFGSDKDGVAIRLYYAKSTDGFSWTIQNNGNPVFTDGANRVDHVSVRKSGSTYTLLYKRGQSNGAEIYKTTSSDLISWTAGQVVLSPMAGNSWSSQGLYKPQWVEDVGGSLRIFHGGIGGEWYIGSSSYTGNLNLAEGINSTGELNFHFSGANSFNNSYLVLYSDSNFTNQVARYPESGVTTFSPGDQFKAPPLINGPAAINPASSATVTGINFGDNQGTGKVELANSSDYAGATKINQTNISSWTDTSIVINGVSIGSLTGGAYLFVTNKFGGRSDGFQVTFGEVTPTPTECPNGNLGNLDCDSGAAVDTFDLSILLGSWVPFGPVPTPVPGHWTSDISPDGGDGRVDSGDLSKLLSNWRTQ